MYKRQVLHRLDRKLCYFETDISATVMYAVTESPFREVTICSAGHPAPLIAHPDRPAELVDISAGVLLGIEPDLPRVSDKVELAPGSALAFYTDGLVERRGGADRESDPYTERQELVRRAFSADHNAETICSHIVAAGLGDESVEDDVAVVVVRRLP